MFMSAEDTDWRIDGATLCTDSHDPHRPALSDFHDAFEVVFVDSTGYVNLCAGMSTATYNRVGVGNWNARFLYDIALTTCI